MVLDLPVELIVEIFKVLSPCDLFQWSMTNTLARNVVHTFFKDDVDRYIAEQVQRRFCTPDCRVCYPQNHFMYMTGAERNTLTFGEFGWNNDNV